MEVTSAIARQLEDKTVSQLSIVPYIPPLTHSMEIPPAIPAEYQMDIEWLLLIIYFLSYLPLLELSFYFPNKNILYPSNKIMVQKE